MRRSGRTTRIIDDLVQDYFNFGCFTARDHEFGQTTRLAHSKRIFELVARRLYDEHGILISLKDAQTKVSFYMYFDPKRYQ